jgi:two-component system, cell cycle sensor histidine kinase and response regulator CckA
VLVVDDEPAIVQSVVGLLETVGLTALTATGGREAIEVFRNRGDGIACVLLDLKMPEPDGEETLAELRRLRSDVPVILMTGCGDDEAIARNVGRGVVGVLRKPFESDQLFRLLRVSMRKT